MRTVEQKLYQFNELDERAKERARDWYREGMQDDYQFSAETVLEDASRIGALLGITINTKPVKLMNGTTRMDPNVYYSAGDRGEFVSFSGYYGYAKGAVRAVKAEAPQDETIHQIASDLQAVQRRYFYKLSAITAQNRRGTLSTDVECENYQTVSDNDVDTVQSAMQAFADWILSNLRTEFEYRESDEVIDENILANEYEFNEDGTRA